MLNPDTQFLVIKLQEGNLEHFQRYLEDGTSRPNKNDNVYYVGNRTGNPVSEQDQEVFDALEINRDYHCAFVVFKTENENQTITKICWAMVRSDGSNLVCERKHVTEDKFVISFFKKCLLGFDLLEDFDGDKSCRYMYFDAHPVLMAVMERMDLQDNSYPKPLADPKVNPAVITGLTYDPSLDPLAQRPEYCIRRYDAFNVSTAVSTDTNDAGYKYHDDQYAKDYDAIVASKAYRRMVDKAQLFSAAKGVHYRTRMTHTQVVCYIARRICDNLGLNSRLAEAIAVGHDLGHTPFGHQGERTLQQILEGKYDVLPMEKTPTLEERLADVMAQMMSNTISKDDILAKLAAEAPAPRFAYGGFKHNYQSVRVAAMLETMCPEFDGLNLSAQTLNGMWLHTGVKDEIKIEDFADGFEEIYRPSIEWYNKRVAEYKEAVKNDKAKGLKDPRDDGPVPYTLEGQVVAAADEIAQRGHDIEDAFSSGLVTVDDLCAYIFPRKAEELRRHVENLRRNILDLKEKNRMYADEEDVLCVGISTIIVDYFIKQICQNTRANMEKYKAKIVSENATAEAVFDSFKNQPVITEKLVKFSRDDKALCIRLENFVNDNVLKSDGVQLFDSNGGNVVLALFKAYYNNPLLLHAGTRKRIWNQYLEEGLELIDISELDYFALKDKWEAITAPPVLVDDKKKDEQEKKKELEKQCKLKEKHKILVRAICDYISGMTDSNAMNEYHKIIHQP